MSLSYPGRSFVMNAHYIIVLGVSGSGKSTIAAQLAQKLDVEFIEGDLLHPESNVEKMSSGQPLTDDDRVPWLAKIIDTAYLSKSKYCVIACSALKKKYRDQLRDGLPGLLSISLEGDRELLQVRMNQRIGHFMPASLLDSQLGTFEAPIDEQNTYRFSISDSPKAILESALEKINRSFAA